MHNSSPCDDAAGAMMRQAANDTAGKRRVAARREAAGASEGNRAMFGILNLNKPLGRSSRDVVNRVERELRPAKAGHAGTLDP
ncbi:MAG: hypothetical protein KDA61_08060, partial [Planctomycetales bacterium]|nr:hypothetical protein [Planctomycetales bacterium]